MSHALSLQTSDIHAPAPTRNDWVILRTNIGLVRRALRPVWVALATVLTLMLAFPLGGQICKAFTDPQWFANLYPAPYPPAMWGATALLVFLVPLAVWRNDRRDQRAYYWTLPVDRTAGALLKVAAGWVWLMVMVTAYITVSNLLVATHAILAHLLLGSSTRLRPPDWLNGVECAVGYGGATIAYLLASAIVVGSRRPWRWIVGTFFLEWFGNRKVPGLIDDSHLSLIHRTLVEVTHGRWGLGKAFTGWDYHAIYILINRTSFNLYEWSTTALLWTAIGSFLLYLAARHRA